MQNIEGVKPGWAQAYSAIMILLYSALIWWSFILAIGDLRSKLPLLKLPIINVHTHSNTPVHQIKYIFMG